MDRNGRIELNVKKTTSTLYVTQEILDDVEACQRALQGVEFPDMIEKEIEKWIDDSTAK